MTCVTSRVKIEHVCVSIYVEMHTSTILTEKLSSTKLFGNCCYIDKITSEF